MNIHYEAFGSSPLFSSKAWFYDKSLLGFFHNLLNNIFINHNTVDALCILNNVLAQRTSNIGQLLHFGDPVIIFFEITRISCDMMKNGAPTELIKRNHLEKFLLLTNYTVPSL